jgi:hypothetical protein
MSGHWFCAGKCNDVVNMPAPLGRFDARVDVVCPVCRQPDARWIKHIPSRSRVTPERAREMFGEIHAAVEAVQPCAKGDVF